MTLSRPFGLDASALALVGWPALALATGLTAQILGAPDAAGWIWTTGVVPVLATLVLKIVQSLRRGEYGLDIIAAFSMAGALAAGEILAGVVVAMMFAGGEALENFAQGRAQREMTALLGRVARTAQLYHDGRLVETAITALRPQDRILVRSGEVVPVDGLVSSDEALLDESALTGEPMPVRRLKGETVASGVANAGTPFDLEAVRTAQESTYAGIVRLVEGARLSKAPMARLADRYALIFMLLTATLATAAWWFTGLPIRALAVLIVATPCPLILAVPVAIVAGMSRCAARGVLVKSARTLELLPTVRTILLDKTGTMTGGYARITHINLESDITENDLVGLAGSLAQASQHVISQALVLEAGARHVALVPPIDVSETAGDGVSGQVGGRNIVIGRPDFVAGGASGGFAGASDVIEPGTTHLGVSVDGRTAGLIVFADVVRADAHDTIDAFRACGVNRIVMLTGDQSAVADHIGLSLGVDAVVADASPDRKLEVVHQEAEKAVTMMVGDGVNDAPALAAASIGVALGARGAAAASEAADLVVLVDRVDRIAEAMVIAKRTRLIALESVLVGIGLSTLGMVAAAFGYLTPLEGALIQEGIDVAVVLNALRAMTGGVLRS